MLKSVNTRGTDGQNSLFGGILPVLIVNMLQLEVIAWDFCFYNERRSGFRSVSFPVSGADIVRVCLCEGVIVEYLKEIL